MSIALITLGIGGVVFLSLFFAQLFKRFQIPDVLFLVGIGVILGPITGLIDVSEIGVVGQVFATLTLLIILFEAGLFIRLKDFLSSIPSALALMLLTLGTTFIVLFPIGLYVLELPLIEAVLVSLLLGSVSSGIAVPLIQKLPVSEKTRSLLALETNLNDVLTVGVLFALVDFSNSGSFSTQAFSTDLGVSFVLALVLGTLTALLWSQIISRVRGIQGNVFMTPALVFVVFGVAELIGGSGIFAAFAFGITLGNLQFIDARKMPWILEFKEFRLTKMETRMFSGLVFLLKTYFFIFIGLSMGFANPFMLLVGFLATFLLYAARIGSVFLAVGKDIPQFDRAVLERLIPKGLVGAAIITLIDNTLAQEFTYSVILFSIVLTSVLIFLLPKPLPPLASEKKMAEGVQENVPTTPL